MNHFTGTQKPPPVYIDKILRKRDSNDREIVQIENKPNGNVSISFLKNPIYRNNIFASAWGGFSRDSREADFKNTVIETLFYF